MVLGYIYNVVRVDNMTWSRWIFKTFFLSCSDWWIVLMESIEQIPVSHPSLHEWTSSLSLQQRHEIKRMNTWQGFFSSLLLLFSNLQWMTNFSNAFFLLSKHRMKLLHNLSWRHSVNVYRQFHPPHKSSRCCPLHYHTLCGKKSCHRKSAKGGPVQRNGKIVLKAFHN